MKTYFLKNAVSPSVFPLTKFTITAAQLEELLKENCKSNFMIYCSNVKHSEITVQFNLPNIVFFYKYLAAVF